MLDVAWGGMLLSQHQRLYQQHQRLFLCQEVLQLHILQPSPSPFHSASFSCSVVSTTFVQNVVSFLGAPLIAHLSGKEAEAMPLNWVFKEFCWHWISKRRSPSWIHRYFAKEAACLTQQWMFTNWIKWMQTFILVVVLLILLRTLDRNDVAKHTSWISLSQGHKDTRLLRESARECSSDTWLLYYWLLWHCKLAIQISPMCQQLLSNIGKFPSSIMAVEPVFVALCFQPLDLTKPRHRKESIQASKVWLWRDWLWCEPGRYCRLDPGNFSWFFSESRVNRIPLR